MLSRRRQRPLQLGERARNKLNRRVGTVDALDTLQGLRLYGLRYDGAQLPAELIERE